MPNQQPNTSTSGDDSRLISKTLILGASLKPKRYAYRAAELLQQNGEPAVGLGLREGKVGEVPIFTEMKEVEKLGPFATVTLYLSPRNQKEYRKWVEELSPQRVIFNPGTEDPSWARTLEDKGIQPIYACTLVMLRSGQYAL